MTGNIGYMTYTETSTKTLKRKMEDPEDIEEMPMFCVPETPRPIPKRASPFKKQKLEKRSVAHELLRRTART